MNVPTPKTSVRTVIPVNVVVLARALPKTTSNQERFLNRRKRSRASGIDDTPSLRYLKSEEPRSSTPDNGKRLLRLFQTEALPPVGHHIARAPRPLPLAQQLDQRRLDLRV